MADHAQLQRAPEAAPRAGHRAGRGAATASASPATAQLAVHDELAQRVPAVREAARMGDLLAARPGSPPVQREPEPDLTGLGEELKSGLEALSGRDLSPVRVHYDSPKPAQLNAKAFTQLPHIYVAPGEEENVPHEGWHAAQQMDGDVKPTLDVAGTPVNDDPRLEREADVMGARALTVQRKAQNGLRSRAVSTAPVAQRVIRLADNADDRLTLALAALVGEPVLTAVESAPQVVLVANSAGRQSETWRKTPRNRAVFVHAAAAHTHSPGDVDILVTVNNRELGGLPVDPLKSHDPRTFEAPRRTPASGSGGLNRLVAETVTSVAAIQQGGPLARFASSSSSSSVAASSSWGDFLATSGLGLSPELELLLLSKDDQRFRPQSLFTPPPEIPAFQAIPPAKTSIGADTVLLHELGHARRELSLPSETLEANVDQRLQAPDPAPLIAPEIIDAVSAGQLDNVIWQSIRNTLNAINTWIHHAKATLADAPGHLAPAPPSQDAATEIQQLIAQAQNEVGLWLEYDVITNVEHPYAASKTEPIRTYHGEEAPLGGGDDLPPLVDFDALLNPTPAPKNLAEVRGRMATEAQRLAGNLPVTLAAIWARYRVYRPAAVASLEVMLA